MTKLGARVRKPRSWRAAAAHRVVRALLIALAAPGAALAHHSISGVYDSSRQVMVEGYVVEFQFVNPHPVLIVAASGGAAADSSPWRLEMDNRYELVDVGVTATTFNRGDRVIATGSAARDESHSLYLMKLDRPADGLRYEQIGFSPRISTTR